MYPQDRRYTKEHEWVRLEGDRGTVGITDYAQEQLGDTCPRRHIGPSEEDVREMLALLGRDSLDALVEETIPAGIRMRKPLDLPAPLGESAALAELRKRAEKNRVFRSFLGMGYHG